MIIPAHAALMLSPRAITGNVTAASVVLPYDQVAFAQPLSPQLPAFSIEMDRWTDWAGQAVGQPNPFVNTVLKQLSDRTGAPAYLRVGANSEDRATLNLTYPVVNLTFPAPTPDTPAPEASSISIGRDWYALSNNLPEGTDFHWGVNLGALNETETLAQITRVAAAFKGAKVNLRELEIGNEADLFRLGSSWTVLNYTNTWNKYAKDASSIIKFGPSSGTYLSPGAFARSVRFGTNYVWTAAATFGAGLLKDKETRKGTRQYAGHLYSGSYNAAFGFQVGALMDKVNIRGNLTTRLADAEVTYAEELEYVLGETNSYSNHGAPGQSNTAEAAIWGTDYMLQAASLGFRRVHFHNGRGFPYSPLQPSILNGSGLDDGLNHADRPHIGPLFNAFLIVGEAIGTTGKAYVAELGTTTPNLAAYGVYENNKLVRVVLINNQVYTAATQGGRVGLNVSLANYAQGQYATVKRFEAPFTNSTSGLTWAGQNFDTASGTPSGNVVEVPVNGSSITLEASSVALICLK